MGGWSAWKKVTACQSGCLEGGVGYRLDRRTCDNPKPQNTAEYCVGDAIQSRLCDDTEICGSRLRKSANVYAAEQCAKFASFVPEISSDGGMQISHDHERDWRACAIFCKLRNNMWYTPRYELNDLQDVASPFFPDGTWCHRDEQVGNFYCNRHRCVPASARRGRSAKVQAMGEDTLVASINMSDPLEVLRVKNYFLYSAMGDTVIN